MYLEVNPLTKKLLNQEMNLIANQMTAAMLRAKEFYDFLNQIQTADLAALPSGDATASGYGSDGQYAIGAFKTALLNMWEAYNSTTKTGTAVPKTFIDNLKSGSTI